MSRPKRRFTPESARIVQQGVVQIRDPLVKTSDKWLIAIGVLYTLWPIDLIPDIIPLIGLVDDFFITGGTLLTALISISSRAKARKAQRMFEERQLRPPLQ